MLPEARILPNNEVAGTGGTSEHAAITRVSRMVPRHLRHGVRIRRGPLAPEGRRVTEVAR